MVPHPLKASNAKLRPRIRRRLPALDELLKRRILGRHVDFDSDELVAPLAVLGDEPAPFEAQDLPRCRPLGNAQHHRSVGCRHLYLGTQHRFLEGDRELQADVGALARVETVRRDLDGHDRVAAATRSLLPLAGKADAGAVLEALRKLEVDGLAIGKGDPLRLQCNRVLERDLEAIGDVGALLGAARAASKATERPSARASSGRAPEQPFEKVAEVGCISATAASEIEILEAGARLRASTATRLVAAEAAPERHLGIAFLVDLAPVVTRALILVGQQVVRGGDLPKALGCLRIVLIPVGVKLLGEAPI